MLALRRRGTPAAIVVTVALAVIAVLALARDGARAELPRGAVAGEVYDSIVTDGSCPAIICTRGRFTGTIKGDFEFQITSLQPTGTDGVQNFVGNSTIHTRDGDVRCADSGSFNGSPSGAGEGVHLCEIVGGTGRYADATGYLQERFHFTGTDGAGAYVGRVVTP